MSDNWIVQNLENALNTWNEKLSEIWSLITQSPETFKGGSIWNVVVNIHGALQAIGYALLVLFFVIGVVKTCGSFAEVKKPEHALKLFVRFAIAKGLITYGMELMLALLEIIQGVISSIMNAAGFGSPQATVLPQEIVTAVEDCGFFESIPLWAVTLIGGLFIWVLSFIMILSVYGRFFKMYMYTAIAPIYRRRRYSQIRGLCVGRRVVQRTRTVAGQQRGTVARYDYLFRLGQSGRLIRPAGRTIRSHWHCGEGRGWACLDC